MDKKHPSKGTPKKAETVTQLTDKAGRATSMVVAEYSGLKHKQLAELRRNLKKVNAEFVVAKNRLFKRSLGNKLASLENLLEQPTATLFAYADEVAPLKELLKFFKTAGAGKIKGGLLGDSFMSEADLTRLSTLPGREVLLGRLAGQLNAPIQGFHYAMQWNLNKFVWAVNAVREKKGNN